MFDSETDFFNKFIKYINLTICKCLVLQNAPVTCVEFLNKIHSTAIMNYDLTSELYNLSFCSILKYVKRSRSYILVHF